MTAVGRLMQAFEKLSPHPTNEEIEKLVRQTLPDLDEAARLDAFAVAVSCYEQEGDRATLVHLAQWDHSRESVQ